jgi:vitamin B12/bleomycin/antimicrobial peptide transport system ATP-binding/permease protein
MNGAAGPTHPQSFFRGFVALTRAYWTGPAQWRVRLMTGSLVLLGVAQVALAIRLNIWSADLFDALERRSTDSAMTQIGVFLLIILGVMAANTAHMVIHRHLQLDWRRWLTARVIGEWMEEARHYQASLIPGDHANPDGRIAEDIRIATEAAVELATSLLYCVLLLISFVGILWSLSGWISVLGVSLPGHLVLLAFLYAGLGAVIAFLLGRPLVRATDNRQTREANLRFGLMRAHESAEPIAIARGEAMERRRLGGLFEAIAPSWRDQSMSLARLHAFSSIYVALAAVLPILVGTPRFLEGALSLGRLMQSGQAFQQVTAALSWPVDNLARIAEWRASVERVLLLDEAIRVVALEAARTGETALNLDRTSSARLGVRDLWLAAPDGTAILSGLTLAVAPGEHVLVDGEAESAAALFRVFAGIWPWGRGQVELPADADMIAVGPRPFLPEGTLRRALLLSDSAPARSDAELRAALEEVGLGHLAERLDETADWGRGLSAPELQRFSFARLLLLRPGWIVLGDAVDALDPPAADLMLGLLAERLPEAGIVLIGRHPGSPERFSRRLTLSRAAGGEVLLHEVYARRQAAMAPRARPLAVVDLLREGYGG